MENQADLIQCMLQYAEGTRFSSITGQVAKDSELRATIESSFNEYSHQYDLCKLEEYLNNSPKFPQIDGYKYNWNAVLDMFFSHMPPTYHENPNYGDAY